MPFIDLGEKGHRHLGAVQFGMTDGAQTVRVRVSDKALGCFDSYARQASDYLVIFERYRAELTKVALRKIRAGAFETDGTILVRAANLGN